LAGEGEHARRRGLVPGECAVAERGMFTADAQGGPVELEHRAWIAGLRVRSQPLPRGRLRKPGVGRGVAGAEAERPLLAGPRDRHAAAVAGVPRSVPARILEQLLWDVLDLPEPQLFALIDVGAAGQREAQERRGPRPACPELEVDRRAVEALGVLAGVA